MNRTARHRSARPLRRLVLRSLLAGLAAGAAPDAVAAQLDVRDLVFTGGFAVENYRGNFSAVTVPVVDSTNQAAATVGEFGLRGGVFGLGDRLQLRFDGGIRQFAATGFRLRDYAPREWAGLVEAEWRQPLGGLGEIVAVGGLRTRSVEDRPPMPLFLQPGYDGFEGRLNYLSLPVQDVLFDAAVEYEELDYEAPALLPQLDLLDRRSWSLEGGASFGSEQWRLRFHGALRESDFRDQSSFDPEDPFRRDRMVQVGGTWTLDSSVYARLGVEGSVNRSNSKRPEFDAISASALLYTPLPLWDLDLQLYGLATGKTYVHDVPFTRLVPGEEAENASILYATLIRPLAPNLDASLRFGWTHAETDIGEAYYSRTGATFLLNYWLTPF